MFLIRRTAKLLFRSPTLAIQVIKFQRAVRRRDWKAARSLMDSIGRACVALKEHRMLAEIFLAASRFGEDELALHWAMLHGEMVGWFDSRTWRGEDLSFKNIQIFFKESERDGVSSGMNLAGWVEKVHRQARSCTLIVDSRIVGLFRRTLPSLSVQPWIKNFDAEPHSSRANKLTLRCGLGVEPETIASLFKPLVPDAQRTSGFRAKYRNFSNNPVIGISWFSGQQDKDIPAFSLWVEFAKDNPQFTFVNLQGGDTDKDGNIPFNLISDSSVNQYKDLDLFASQLAALDLVISVTNTGAHLAASLGVSTIVLRDDKFTRGWPVLSQTTPWYPSVYVLGKEGRSWKMVFDELKILVGIRLNECAM